MVKLINIKKNGTVLSADYDPELSGKYGRVSIEIVSGTVIDYQYSELDEPMPMYFHHALSALEKWADANEIPCEKLVMWY